MSLILDALSRAERDKRRSTATLPDLIAEAPADAPLPATRGRGLALALVAATVAILAVVAYLLWLQPERAKPEFGRGDTALLDLADDAPVAGAVRPDSAQLPVSPAAAESAARIGDPTDAPDTADVAAVSEGGAAGISMSPDVAALYARAPAVSPAAKSNAAPDSIAADGSAQPSAAEGVEEEVDIQRVLRRVQAEAGRQPLPPHPAPMLDELSQQFRDSVPTLMYLRHDYNPQGRSTVVINGETLGSGQRTRGVELREILPDSIILRFADTEFRLRSLNSWVNL